MFTPVTVYGRVHCKVRRVCNDCMSTRRFLTLTLTATNKMCLFGSITIGAGDGGEVNVPR